MRGGGTARRAATWRPLVPRLVGLLLAAGSVGAARAAQAQEVACDRGDTEVRGLDFTGNRAFRDDQLGAVVVATPSSSVYRYRALRYPPFTWFGQRRCIRPSEVVLDRARLILFYRNRGYPDVTVDTVVTHDGRAVRLRFAVAEGRAIRVDSVGVSWADTVPGASRILRGLPIRVGAAFDKLAMNAARDSIVARLGNAGYPWAQVLANYETQRDAYTARIGYDILPGTRTRIGQVLIVQQPRAGGDSTPHVSPRLTRKLTGLKRGSLYRDRDVAAARRNLYLTEAYENVAIERDSARGSTGADSLVNLRVLVSEGFMRAAQLSGGYGTIDCFRGQGDLTFRSVQVRGLATRLEFTGRVSKIGRGAPFGSRSTGEKLCPQISAGDRFDPYSDKLNYYTGVTLRQPLLSGVPNILPTLTLFSQRASEYKAFRRDVPIGVVATYNFAPRRTLPQVISYGLEFGTTQAQPAVFCAVFNACQEEDRARLQQRLRTATLGWSITRNRANDPVNPNHGSIARLDLRHASRYILSDSSIQFNKAIGDVSWYLPGGGANVLALRLRAGSVFGRNLSFGRNGDVPDFVPQQERLFAGGAQTVRGFRQNELGPQVYVADRFDTVATGNVVGGQRTFYLQAPTVGTTGQLDESVGTRAVPTGGNRLVVANAEYRLRPPVLSDLLQLVAFVDAGNVWDKRVGSDVITLFATPGFGMRVASPFGPIRVDFGYNPHRPSPGAIFHEDVNNEDRPLYCVTPGNTIEYVNESSSAVPRYRAVDTSAQCPASYQPRAKRGLRAWNISLAIAQAF
jgi:outer membrane protein insertion porin family/translocation and assembly module TamA